MDIISSNEMKIKIFSIENILERTVVIPTSQLEKWIGPY